MTKSQTENPLTNNDSSDAEKMKNIEIEECNKHSNDSMGCLLKVIGEGGGTNEEEIKKSEYVVKEGDTLYRIFEDHSKNEEYPNIDSLSMIRVIYPDAAITVTDPKTITIYPGDVIYWDEGVLVVDKKKYQDKIILEKPVRH